jgi:aspartate/methionine/tyrosine aminotransferase
LCEILCGVGLDAHLPAGGFYLWVPVPVWASEAAGDVGGAAWMLTEALAQAAGVLVSPGELYGDSGVGFVRVAAVQPDDRIELVARRLSLSSNLGLRPAGSVQASSEVADRGPGAPQDRGRAPGRQGGSL